MKKVSLAALAALVALSAPAKAEDAVRACIAASTDAQTLRSQGKLLAAREQMVACARDACPPIVRSHCARWLSEIEAQIPSVVVRAENADGTDAVDARVTIDGRAGKLDGQPVRLDPGPHTVVVENDRGARKEQQVLLVAGETARKIALRFPPLAQSAAPEAPEQQRIPTGAWILGGVGTAALAGATYFGFAAKSELDSLNGSCSPHCTDAQAHAGRTDALVFDVLLGAGAAAVGGALIWALAFPTRVRVTEAASAPRLDVRPVAGGAVTSLTLHY